MEEISSAVLSGAEVARPRDRYVLRSRCGPGSRRWPLAGYVEVEDAGNFFSELPNDSAVWRAAATSAAGPASCVSARPFRSAAALRDYKTTGS